MAAPPRRLEFDYAHAVFLQRGLLLVGVWIVATVLLASLAQVDVVWVVVVSGLVGGYALVFGLSPLLTRHWLTRSRIILRQGWYFRQVLPLREVRSVAAYDGEAKVGLRGDLARRTLFVTGSKVGLVAAELDRPRRFWQVMFATSDRIVFDVTSRDRFLEAIAARRASFPPIEPDRADADFRD